MFRKRNKPKDTPLETKESTTMNLPTSSKSNIIINNQIKNQNYMDLHNDYLIPTKII